MREIREVVIVWFCGESKASIQKLEQLRVSDVNLLESIDEHLNLLDEIFVEVTEQRKISYIIEKLPIGQALKQALDYPYVDVKVFYLRRKFKQFLVNRQEANANFV